MEIIYLISFYARGIESKIEHLSNVTKLLRSTKTLYILRTKDKPTV